MYIGINTAVFCEKQPCGTICHLIIQPKQQVLTHLAVKPANKVERLVAVARIAGISDAGIELNETSSDFYKLATFSETHLLELTESIDEFEGYGAWSTSTDPMSKVFVPVTQYNTPPGSITLNHQTQIEALNGHMGQFRALMVDKDSYEIEQIVFQRGHLWDRKREMIAAALIDRLEGDVIYLKIHKADLNKK